MYSLIRGVFENKNDDIVEVTECYSPFDSVREAEDFNMTLPQKGQSYYEIVPTKSPLDNVFKEAELRVLGTPRTVRPLLPTESTGQEAESFEHRDFGS